MTISRQWNHCDPSFLRHASTRESGTELRYIQELLGHKNSKTTEIYTHVSPCNPPETVCRTSRRPIETSVASEVHSTGDVLDTVADELLSEDVIKRVLEECRKQAKKRKPDEDHLSGIRDAIRQVDREIQNLTQAIATGGPIEELVDRLKACKARKQNLSGQLEGAREARENPLANVAWEDVEEAIGDLRGTLEYTTMEEKRSLLQENISEVSIPKNGNALLEANPAGLFKTAGVLLNGDPEGSRTPVS